MQNNLEQLRKKIDALDKKILTTLSERLATAEKIGKIKKMTGKNITDLQRERELFALHQAWAEDLQLPEKLVIKVFKLILQQSKKIQKICK
jgi:chorismate mutase/prephenate dehydratase